MKGRQISIRLFTSLFLVAGLGLTGGCITMDGGREEAMQQSEDMRVLQEDISRMKTDLERLRVQQDQLVQQVDAIRARPRDTASLTDVQQLQGRIAEVDRRISALDAARAQDRQEIVNTLSGNINKIIAAQAPSRGSARSSDSGSSRRTGGTSTQKGVMHTVAAGDTLSAIASAYKANRDEIIKANNLKDPQHLRVGQELFIPATR